MSVSIGPSRPEDVRELKALWKQAFGDSDAEIDLFFREAYVPAGLFVLREEGRVASMAAWFSLTLCREKCGWPTAYLYAVATDEACRGRGHCRRLLDYMAGALSAAGIECLCLVPGSAQLVAFYEKLGFGPGLTHDAWRLDDLPAVTGAAAPTDPPTYLTVREDLLEGGCYVSYPVPVLAYQQQAAIQAGGDLLLLEQDGLVGCACACIRGGEAMIQELLWPGDRAQGAALVCRALGVRRAVVRTPGTGRDFGMVRWLRTPPDWTGGYLGLAFD